MEVNLKPFPKVEIDTSTLFNQGLTPDLYLLLYSKYYSSTYEAPELLLRFHLNETSLSYLENEGYIKITDNRFELRDKANQLFNPSTSDQMFYELLSMFPMKVPGSTGAYRILRPKDPSATLNQTAKRKYLSIIKGNKPLHDRIIKALSNELDNRRNSNSFTYMQNFTTWLNQRTWEMYEGVENEIKTERTESL